MSDALSRHRTHETPPSRPIPGREADMVRNKAGGYVFAKDVWTRLSDFLILGTEGGTYYANEREHTFDSVAVVRQAVAEDGLRALRLAVEISTARPARAPKNYPALYLVAYALARGDLDARRAAAEAVPQVARTTDHLAHLFGYWKSHSSKVSGRDGVGRGPVGGRVVRRAWANWFRHGEPDQVAYKILKAGQRKTGDGEAFRPGDLLRLSRPEPANETESALFGLATGRGQIVDYTGHFASAKAYYEAQRADTPAKAVKAILAYHVPWEFLPSEVLKDPDVWRALIPHLGMTALLRNLARMTQIGVFKPLDRSIHQVGLRLADTSPLHQARIHPFDVMLARLVYGAGRSQADWRAPLKTWSPVGHIVDALDDAYERSFAVAEKIPQRLVVAVDRSGSMSWPVQHGATALGSAYHVASATAQSLLRTCDSSWSVEFDQQCHSSRLRRNMSLGEVLRMPHGGGGTDVAAPIAWALQNRVSCDGFVILTDSETWAGRRHAHDVLADYRQSVNPAARVIVVSTTAVQGTIVDPADPGVLNIAGFDSALPTLVSGYLAGTGQPT